MQVCRVLFAADVEPTVCETQRYRRLFSSADWSAELRAVYREAWNRALNLVKEGRFF
jgi:hypothetical protein